MCKCNVLENIKADDVIRISLDESAYTGEPIVCVETHSDGEVQQKITEGFQIHMVNEFLRSLNLCSDSTIQFYTYSLYGIMINHFNTLLAIRKAMQEVSNKPYDEIGYNAKQVYQCILNHLMFAHQMASESWEYAIHHRPLKDWVAEALLLLCKNSCI